MSKIKMFAPVSMDGYASRIDGDIDWTPRYLKGEDYGFKDFIKSVGSVVLNRVHYMMLQSYGFKWPFGDLPCYVITRQAFGFPPSRNIHFVRPDGRTHTMPGVLDRLKQTDGDIWLAGDHELVSQFRANGLIDEITLLYLPVTLGSGLPLIRGRGGENDWKLAAVRQFDNGVIRKSYRP